MRTFIPNKKNGDQTDLSRKNNIRFRRGGLIALIFLYAAAGQAEEPPAILQEVEPVPASRDITLRQPVIFTFSRPLLSDGFERGLTLFPPQQMNITWKDARAECTPAEPLIPSTRYLVSLSPNLQTEDHLPLAATWFTTAAYAAYVAPDRTIHLVSESGMDDLEIGLGNNPVWNREQTGILFDRDGEIWSVGRGGTAVRQLTNDQFLQASLPEPHPRNDFIAFVGTNTADADNIYLLDQQAQAVDQLTPFFEPEKISFIRWSPDGRLLAFLRKDQIWLVNADGSELRKMTPSDLSCKHNFAWSPGGTKLVFVANENIWVGELFDAALRKISFDDPQVGAVDWSTEDRIVYISDGIVLNDASGGREVRISSAAMYPVWLSDGVTISYLLRLYNQQKTAQLWVMNTQTQEKRKIAEVPEDFHYPQWSKPR